MPVKVFVYGTLRTGDCRHGVRSFLSCLAQEAFLDGFMMLDLGGFPGVTPGKGRIRGEIHEYDGLDTLDMIEGFREQAPEQGLYNRCEVEVQLPDGSTETCWVYTFNTNRLPRIRWEEEDLVIESGDWFEHRGLYEKIRDVKQRRAAGQ